MPSEKGPEHQETAPKVNDQEEEKIVFQITEEDIVNAINRISPSGDRNVVDRFLGELGIELSEETRTGILFVQRKDNISELNKDIKELERMLNLRYPMPEEEKAKRRLELAKKRFDRDLLKRQNQQENME